MTRKKKVTAAVAAVAAAATLLTAGTFAWQSISQTALNEASDVINPGGRLHDDFNGENKDIYVENFADDPIYARIRLEEYFEIIANYGALTDENPDNDHIAVPNPILGSKTADTDENGELTGTYTYTYEPYIFDGNVDENGAVSAGIDINDVDEETGAAKSYWTWQTGGQTVYMPTFNLNKDSLAADINGIYEDGSVGTISERILDLDADDAQYSTYTDWATYEGENSVIGDGATLTGDEIYDADANDIEDENTTTVEATHTAKPTETATLISMADWLALGEDESKDGYWVYDTDGWVYWSSAIPGRNEDGSTNATGLLLDGIELNQVMDDTWYYAINVVAQFVTADDVGKADGTGFYDTSEGLTAPTAEAEELLKAIGVTSVDDEAAEEGGNDDEGDDDASVSFNIEYAGMNEDDTIYVSAADFANGGAGVQFTSFLGHMGESAWAEDAEWQLVAEDENEYTGVETEEGTSTFTVNVNKTAYELTDGDQFKFAVTVTNETHYPGESFTVNMTVIIGESPADDSEITDDAALQDALNAGGDIDLGENEITAEEAESNGLNETFDYLMSEGGTLTGGTINSTTGSYATLFINNENNWPVDGDGANDATINDTTINTASTFGVYTQAIDANVALNNVTVNGSIGGVYAEYGNGTVTLTDMYVTADGGNTEQPWFNSAVAAGMGANVVVESGYYEGVYAAYVFSSGATLTINGGEFYGELKQDNAALIIQGGTFDHDPTAYVADGYEAVDNGDGTWTVQEKTNTGLSYTVISPENWDGSLARRGETSVTLKVDGDYSADDLEWSHPNTPTGAVCIDATGITENEDGSATISHVSGICGGGGGTVRVALTSDPSVYLDIEIGCDGQ